MLRAAPRARLWLLQPSAGGEAALRSEVAACGVAAAVGWSANARGKLGPRMCDLSASMDPRRLAGTASPDQAADRLVELEHQAELLHQEIAALSEK